MTTTRISRILGDLCGGSISALIMLCYAVGYGLVIFSGGLERYASVGIPSLLVGVCLVGLLIAVWSSQQFCIARPDSNTAAIRSVSLASIALDTRAKGGSESAVIVTVLMALTTTLLMSGVVAYGLGRLHQGGLIQLAPFSVVAGVIAASGFLVFSEAFRVFTRHSLDFSVLAVLRSTPLIAVLPALGVPMVLLLSKRIRNHFLGVPGAILLGTVGFYGLAASAGLPFGQLRALGMLLEPASRVSLPPHLTIPLDLVAWQVIGSHVIELGAVVVVAFTETALAHSETLYGGESSAVKPGGTTRLLGVWASVLCLTIVIAFPALISFLPKPVLAGLLLYLGGSMLLKWAIASRRRLPLHEYALLLLILGATALTGFLAGALLGLAAACVLFAWNYGRVTCIKSTFTGQSYRSRVRRTVRDDKILAEHGASTFGLSLQGYLFFGTAQIIVNQVTEATRRMERRVIVIDMQAVRGMDASALMCFRKLRQLCEPHQIALVFAGLDDKQRDLLRRCEVLDKAEFDFLDLDHALEWIETRTLNEFSGAPTEASLRKMLAPHFRSQNLERLLFLLEPIVFEPGEVVLTRGERGDSLFFIERGQLGVKLTSGNGASVRL
ncbi:MAG: SLC26A/SulP transporter family protein, partial [Verrucomicrobia bacterium]|nr:SLC26A/SulP transporter family protein [Verrucomicrobiota bacterium]